MRKVIATFVFVKLIRLLVKEFHHLIIHIWTRKMAGKWIYKRPVQVCLASSLVDSHKSCIWTGSKSTYPLKHIKRKFSIILAALLWIV